MYFRTCPPCHSQQHRLQPETNEQAAQVQSSKPVTVAVTSAVAARFQMHTCPRRQIPVGVLYCFLQNKKVNASVCPLFFCVLSIKTYKKKSEVRKQFKMNLVIKHFCQLLPPCQVAIDALNLYRESLQAFYKFEQKPPRKVLPRRVNSRKTTHKCNTISLL